jgi:hypothetical protein
MALCGRGVGTAWSVWREWDTVHMCLYSSLFGAFFDRACEMELHRGTPACVPKEFLLHRVKPDRVVRRSLGNPKKAHVERPRPSVRIVPIFALLHDDTPPSRLA